MAVDQKNKHGPLLTGEIAEDGGGGRECLYQTPRFHFQTKMVIANSTPSLYDPPTEIP